MEHITDDICPGGPNGRPLLSSEMIDRYLANECSVDERAVVEQWRAAEDVPDAAIADLTAVLKMNAAQKLTPPSAPSIEQRVHAVLRQSDLPQFQETSRSTSEIRGNRLNETQKVTKDISLAMAQTRTRTIWASLTVSFAATIVCAALLIIGWQRGRYELDAGIANQISTYTTYNGERARITLPDGTQVILNVASRLEVPANYAAGNRNVRLEGEALFTVTHRANTPFTVIAGPSITKVLGTRFVVRHYASDTTALVAVQEGKVAVQSTVLSADQEALVYANQTSSIRSVIPNRFKFADGILSFDGVRLQDAIPDVNRWFNADVRLGDPALADLLLGGEYSAGSAANLAEILKLTFDVRVVRQGRVLTLYPQE